MRSISLIESARALRQIWICIFHLLRRTKKNGDQMKSIEKLAFMAAVSSWSFGNEGRLAVALQHTCFGRDKFKKWMGHWILARRIPQHDYYDHLQKLIEFIENEPRQAFIAASRETAVELVEKYTRMAAGETTGVPITWNYELSLFSKYAFSCNPKIFVPYDETVRTALVENFHITPKNKLEGNYREYYKYFYKFKDIFKKQIANQARSNEFLERMLDVAKCGEVKMSKDLLFLRATDKSLMLLGGFDKNKMRSSLHERVKLIAREQ